MNTAMSEVEEESLIREQIAQIKLPKGVRLDRVVQSQDWQGNPAVRIYFAVSTSIPLTKKRVEGLADLDREMFERVMKLELDKWPFMEIIEEE